jgi:predicted nuclease with TOPRIM domain
MAMKDKMMTEAMKLAGHPAVAPLLQDERFMKLIMSALSVPGKLTELSDEQRQNLINVLGLAKREEVSDLHRTVRSMDDELSRLRAEIERLHDELDELREPDEE